MGDSGGGGSGSGGGGGGGGSGTKYTNVVWLGGSYAPPTIAHFGIAKAVGVLISDRGGRGAVCIVPISKKYPKASVSEACAPGDVRLELVTAMVEALNADPEKPKNIDFILEDYEYRDMRPGGVPTVDSLPMLADRYPGATIYFAQGQDSIASLFKKEWVRSEDLLDLLSTTYELILFPRDSDKGHAIKGSIGTPDAIVERIHIVPASVTSTASSSAIRKALRKGDAAEELFHPAVYAKFQEIQRAYPDIYKSLACEPPPSASKGGSRKTVYKRKSTKRRHKKSKKNKAKARAKEHRAV
jgi:nicotinic acid mononucleotide adenylyltransferase